MNVRLALLPLAMRCGLRRVLLDRLGLVTARALGGREVSYAGLGWEARLELYAGMTAAQAGALLDRGDPGAVAVATRELREGAHDLGARARRLLGLRTADEALRALCSFYRQIGIAAACRGGRELHVRDCLFAGHFELAGCRLIGALDDGFAAGLSGGKGLRFAERITAGDGRCLAVLEGRAVA